MPRQTRWVATGVYQPTYQPRHAYGPRGWYRRELVEDYATAVGVIDARQIARYARGAAMPAYLDHLAGVPVVSVPMPRGGIRYLLVCPRCHKRATRLYGRYHPMYRRMEHACRVCWGLRYASQYQGRRIEAHPDYLQAVMRRQIARTPGEPRGYLPVPARRQRVRIRHILRMGRYERASARQAARTYHHLERREVAYLLALAVLIARSEAEQRRTWRKIVNQVLWHRNTDTMRALLADDATPQWAKTLLQDALERAEKGEKLPKDARKAIKTALETDTNGQLSAIIEQARMDDLRGRYAALSPARRHTRAA